MSSVAPGIDHTIDQAFQPIARAMSDVVFFAIPAGDAQLPLIVVWLVVAAAFATVYFNFISFRAFATSAGRWSSFAIRCSRCTIRFGPAVLTIASP